MFRAAVVVLAVFMLFSACSLDSVQNKLDSYSKMDTKDLAEQLLLDASDASNRAKQIAWCQAKVINDSGLPQAIVDALITNDGRTVVQRARDLKRPGLATKLKACVEKYRYTS